MAEKNKAKESSQARNRDPENTWPVGKEINGLYRIESILGEGGMGLVYKAMDLAINRTVVIKSLKPCYAKDEKIKSLFRREAEAWIKIGVHPNIIRAYDVQEIEWLPRIIAEYADDGSLNNYFNDCPFPMDKALDIAAQICWGMAYAHDRGLAHRDLKPENIFMTNNIAKVADFGLAKMVDESNGVPEDMELSRARHGLTIGSYGTPAYMPPEQWQCQAGKEADIYAFGVIMYELFCGRRPFDFSEAHPNARNFLYRNAHENEKPPQPKSLRPNFPPLLSELMLQCLEKNHAARPKDFRTIAEILNEVSQKHFDRQLAKELAQEELNRQAKIDQARALARLGCSCRFQGDLNRAIRLQKDALKIFQPLDEQAGIGACYNNMGIIFYSQGEYNTAMQTYEKSLRIAEAINDQFTMSTCYLNMGSIFSFWNNYSRALQMYENSLEIAEHLDDQAVMAKCYNNMGLIFCDQHEFGKAVQVYEKSLKLAETTGDQDTLSKCYLNIGNIYMEQTEYEKAMQMYEKSLEIAETIGNQADVSNCHTNMGIIYKNQGEYDRAIEIFEQSLKMDSTFGSQSGMGKDYYSMGQVFDAKGKHNEAIQAYKKGLRIFEAIGDYEGISNCCLNIGNIFYAQEEYSKAIQMWEKSLPILRRTNAPNQKQVAQNIAFLKQELGK